MISEKINVDINIHCGTAGINYYGSLDAMHFAEKTLSPREWQTYLNNLKEVVGDFEKPKGIQHACSYQKAEAFYRTLNNYGKPL